jgi:hypothetical protein
LAWDVSAEGLGVGLLGLAEVLRVGLLELVTAMSVTATTMAMRTPTAIATPPGIRRVRGTLSGVDDMFPPMGCLATRPRPSY